MLTPQYNVRHLLLLVALSAGLCLVPALAARGHQWAVAMSMALFGALAVIVVAALLYVVTRALGAVLGRLRARARRAGGDS